MAHALQSFRTGGLTEAVLPVRRCYPPLGIRGARTLEQDENRDRAGPLDVATMRDIGARHEYPGLRALGSCPGLRGSAPPLHCQLGPVRITVVVFPARDGLRSATDFDATRLDDECEGPDIALPCLVVFELSGAAAM